MTRYLVSVTTLRLDFDRCTGCERCAEVCPHGVLVIVERRAAIADADACMECGACAKNCAAGAIALHPGVGCAMSLLMAKFPRGRATRSRQRATR